MPHVTRFQHKGTISDLEVRRLFRFLFLMSLSKDDLSYVAMMVCSKIDQSALTLPSSVCKQSERNQGLLGVLQASDEQRSRLVFTRNHACRHTDR